MDQYYFVTPFAALGDQSSFPIPTDPGGGITFQQGWGPDYALDQTSNPNAKPIDRASTNYLMYVITNALAALQRTGIPEWITSANNNGVALPYPKYATVRYSATTPATTFETYVSVIDANTSVPGADANWQPIASIVAAASDVVTGTSSRLPVTPLTLKSYPGNSAQTFNVATATAAAHAVPLLQAQGLRGTYQGLTSVNASTTFTAAQACGSILDYSGSTAAQTLTLPTRASVVALAANAGVAVMNTATVPVTLAVGSGSGDSFVVGGATPTSIVLQPGDNLEFIPSAANQWLVTGGSAVRQYYPLLAAGLAGGAGAQSSALNVKASLTAAGTSITFTADEVTFESALGGTSFKGSAFSQTLNISGTGAGGMDTGSAPVSGYVAAYAARNPTTGAVTVFGQNATSSAVGEIYGGANAPPGYTQTKLISVWPTNGSSQFVIGYQFSREVFFFSVTVLNNSATQQAFPASLNIATAVPPNAKACSGDGGITNTAANSSGDLYVAGSSTSIGLKHITQGWITQNVSNINTYAYVPIITPQTMFYKATTGTGTGMQASIFISSYVF